MAGTTIQGVILDHVAHAVPRWQDVWTRYAVDFGAEWNSGGPGRGFAPGQLRFGNNARIEILMPHDPHLNDFLVRFLARHGPGPHHLTFKVPDLDLAIDLARSAGYEPIGISRDDPQWMEAFLHPKIATGIVVQIAEAPVPWSSPPPDDYPSERRQRRDGSGPVPPAALRRVVHAVADLDRGTELFVGLLGASITGHGERADYRWADLDWGVPLGLRLVAPTGTRPDSPLRRWLGGRSGRVHHLLLEVEDPESVPGVAYGEPASIGLGGDATDQPRWVVDPEFNAGVRLVLASRSTSACCLAARPEPVLEANAEPLNVRLRRNSW